MHLISGLETLCIDVFVKRSRNSLNPENVVSNMEPLKYDEFSSLEARYP